MNDKAAAKATGVVSAKHLLSAWQGPGCIFWDSNSEHYHITHLCAALAAAEQHAAAQTPPSAWAATDDWACRWPSNQPKHSRPLTAINVLQAACQALLT